MRTYIIVYLISFVVSVIVTRAVRDWAIRRNWVDDIGGRKIHTRPTPRLGGIGVISGMATALLLTLVWSNDILDAFHQDVELISALCGGPGDTYRDRLH